VRRIRTVENKVVSIAGKAQRGEVVGRTEAASNEEEAFE